MARSLISLLCSAVILNLLVKGCCCVSDDSRLEKVLIIFLSRIFRGGVHELLYVNSEYVPPGLFWKNLCKRIRRLNSLMSVVNCLFQVRELLQGMNFKPLLSMSVCVWLRGWLLRLTIGVFSGLGMSEWPLGAFIVKNSGRQQNCLLCHA